MEAITSLTVSVCALGLAESVSEAFFPDSKMKDIFRFICGLVLLLCIVRPLFGIVFSENVLSGNVPEEESAGSAEENTLLLEQAVKMYIVDSCGLNENGVEVKTAVENGCVEKIDVRLSGATEQDAEKVRVSLGSVCSCEINVISG